ncbi:bola-like protein [Dacryopinax primogenitus]|uniref:Bola-like protein n=1 Tax=Dacryopinax primogenitus (strain DJM 731) TaxID=1858805 RepID=M5FWE4_DACPD|nr:bola-like protein [Dacryopinax primogenitus]EJT97711.1 bola-like protein [Dacryopinax primogenitus]
MSLTFLRPFLPLLRTTRTRAFSTTLVARNSPPQNPEPEGQLTEGERTIASKLREVFSPSRLDVEDVSGGCGTFYAITIQSSAFRDMTLVKQHKLVTKTLKEDIEGIHGLQLKTIPEPSS